MMALISLTMNSMIITIKMITLTVVWVDLDVIGMVVSEMIVDNGNDYDR